VNDRVIIGVLVGNENIGKLGEIKRLIRQVKTDAKNIPVSTPQKNADWLKADAELANMVDFIAVNIYPAWCWSSNSAGGAPAASCGSSTAMSPEAAFNSFVTQFNEVKAKFPNKQIVVTETGYPTNFGKNAGLGTATSRSYACQYMQKVSNWARDEKQVVFIYEMMNSQNSVDESSQFNYNFGIQDKFPLPSFKKNFPNMNCPAA
jgi:exo-beta-1,3-glucanase (GH17 family)